jgi:L-alanine-DL-glutamate epimerase-like enolase superfamily enzyme
VGLLRIQTDSPLEGWSLGIPLEVARSFLKEHADLLVGQNPLNRERIWLDLVDREIPNPIRAHIDVALWDLAAKSVGLSVRRMIGGFRSEIAACMSPVSTETSTVLEATHAQKAGFNGYKVRCASTVADTSDLIQEIRQAVGHDFYIMVDGAQQFSADDALLLGRVLDGSDVYWFENPLNEADHGAYERVAAALDTPLAVTALSSRHVSKLLSGAESDMVIASAPLSGGITDILKMGRAAEAFGVSCLLGGHGVSHGFAHAHILGAMKNAPFLEAAQPGAIEESPYITNPLKIESGRLKIPDTQGLGIIVNWPTVDEDTARILSTRTGQ